ncbi:MAG TPA: tetratricopeptide repeat protein [Terriglobales bacterium]
MHETAQGTRILRFGLYEVDLRNSELRKDGVRIRLQDQPLQVLTMLLREPGEIVTREEIQKELWPSDTFVDFDHGLNKAVSKLREALNDSPSAPRFIETVARRGYRFLAPVKYVQNHFGNGRSIAKRIRVAILPFQNLSGDPQQEYFSDGLTEEMIIQVGQLQPSQLSVIARTSVMPFKGSPKGIADIGQELQADYVLEGSVRRFHDTVRISAQLVQVDDETCLWSETYEREIADVFTIQREVARKIGASLAFELLPEQKPEPSVAKPTNSALAHEAYLHARFSWNKRTEDSVNDAIHQFSEALKSDPGYALAHAGLANCYGMLGWYGAITPKEAGEKAIASVQRALQIDPRRAEVQCSLALLKFWYEWDWASAEAAFRKSIENSPNYAAAQYWYGSFLTAMRRFDEADRAYRRAAELDPKSATIEKAFADLYLYRREYGEAISRYRRIIEREPRFFEAHHDLGRAYLFSGRHPEAVAALESAIELSGSFAGMATLGYAFAKAGRMAEASSIIEDLKHPASQRGMSPAGIATILAASGETEEALCYLEQAFETRSYSMVSLDVDPVYDSLRPETRFKRLLRRMSFPASLQEASA